MGQRDGLTPNGPTKGAENVVAFFVPPVCREEVLGDLYERYTSPRQYCFDAIRTIPLVIASRVRRTADLQVLFTLALAAYASFLGAAWFWGRGLLHAQWGLLRLAIPVAPAMVALMLEDAYAKPGRRSPLQSIRGPVLGLGLTLLLQGTLWASARDLTVPRWIMLYGGAMSILLISTLRMLLQPAIDRPQSADGPAHALTETGSLPERSIFILKVLAVVMIGMILRQWQGDISPRLLKPFIGIVAAGVILHQLNKRA